MCPAIPERARPRTEADEPGLHLLVVDDDDILRATLESMLRHAGYSVVMASDAAQAWEHFLRPARPIDGVISDVAMPGERGDAMVARMLAHRPELPVLLITGYPLEEVVVPPSADPAQVRLLRKPFRLADLLRALPGDLRQEFSLR